MTVEPVVVVGDRFEEFLANRGTVAASVLLSRLRAGEQGPACITVGQGLSAEQLTEVAELVANGPAEVTFAQGDVPLPVERRLTHKREDKNVLIGAVEEVGPDHYRAALVLDQRVEVLEDHLTGQHIPAVTLLEAARQTWTVVTERFLLTDARPVRFVINSVSSFYRRFVFPLPATLEYRLVRRERGHADETIEFTVEVLQGGQQAAVFEAGIRVIPQLFAAKQEAMAARQAVRDALSSPVQPLRAAPAGSSD